MFFFAYQWGLTNVFMRQRPLLPLEVQGGEPGCRQAVIKDGLSGQVPDAFVVLFRNVNDEKSGPVLRLVI